MCNYPDIDSLFLYDGYGLGACDESKAYHFDKNIVKFFHRINNLCTKNVNGSFWMVGEYSTDIVKYIVENDQVTKYESRIDSRHMLCYGACVRWLLFKHNNT